MAKINISEEQGFPAENFWDNLSEGQLSVDVIEKPEEIIVHSAIAGVEPEDLDVSVTTDTITIRGHRHHQSEDNGGEICVQECYWGDFSRSIILPCHVKPDETDATIKNGILTIRLLKSEPNVIVSVREEEE